MHILIAHSDESYAKALKNEFEKNNDVTTIVEPEDISYALKDCGPFHALISEGANKTISVQGLHPHFNRCAQRPDSSYQMSEKISLPEVIKTTYAEVLKMRGDTYPFLTAGPFKIDVEKRVASMMVGTEEKPLQLNPSEYGLLAALALFKNQLIDRDSLLTLMYGFDHCIISASIPGKAVQFLRDKIEKAGGEREAIKTRYTSGYSFPCENGMYSSRQYGPFVINTDTEGAYFDGQKLAFSKVLFEIFTSLIQNHSKVLSASKMVRSVFNCDLSENPAKRLILTDGIKKIRRELKRVGCDPHGTIETIYGEGYKFNINVQPMPLPEPEPIHA